PCVNGPFTLPTFGPPSMSVMQALNNELFGWFGAGYAPNPHLLWLAVTIIRTGAWLCVAVAGWAAWRHPAQRGYTLLTLVAAGVAALLARALSDALDMPRPFVMGLSPLHIEHGVRGAMPSAHATVMFTVAFMFLLRPSLRGASIVLLALAALMGWARVY